MGFLLAVAILLIFGLSAGAWVEGFVIGGFAGWGIDKLLQRSGA